jgi:hypothetical protein
MSVKATCLCGKIRIEAKSIKSVGACHCRMCRRWTGGPWLAVDCGSDVTIEGKELIGIYDSSQWAERAFCKNCGSNLFYRLKHNQQVILSAGLLESEEGLTFDHQVFVDEKPAYYDFSNQTENMTGPEVFAKYAPKE